MYEIFVQKGNKIITVRVRCVPLKLACELQ